MHIVSPPLPDIRTACGWSLHNPRLVVRAIELALNISGWPKYEISLYEELLSRIHINLSDTVRMKLQALKSLDVSVIPLTEWHAFEAVATTIIDGVADTDDATEWPLHLADEPADVDVLQLYDSFTITVLTLLEKGHEQMFCVNLRMSIARHDLHSSLRCVLSTLCETI